MKKILALTLALILVLSLCACGNTSAGSANNDPAGNNAPAGDSAPAGDNDAGSSTSQETGYVGTWKVVPPDDEPFPPFIMILNEDGTGSWGTKLDKMEPRFWYEDEKNDEQEGAIEVAREDNMGYGNDAYIMEDGRLYMEFSLTVNGDKSYDHLIFERQ